MSGITLDGRLFMQVRPTSYDAEAVVGALRVCSYAKSPVRSSSSGMARLFTGRTRSRPFGSRGTAKRLHLEHLPGYGPDLNPDEGIWNYREASWSWGMSVVPISMSCLANSSKPKNVCATKKRASKLLPKVEATWFSFLARGQSYHMPFIPTYEANSLEYNPRGFLKEAITPLKP
jgi:hypothetical protein